MAAPPGRNFPRPKIMTTKLPETNKYGQEQRRLKVVSGSRMTSCLEKWYVALDELETNLIQHETRFNLNVGDGTRPLQSPLFGECDSSEEMTLQAEILLGFTIHLYQHTRIIHREIYQPGQWRSYGFDENMHLCFARSMQKWKILAIEIRDLILDDNDENIWPRVTSLIWSLTENIDNANMALHISAETVAMIQQPKPSPRRNKKIRRVFTAKRRTIMWTNRYKRRGPTRFNSVSTTKTSGSMSTAAYSANLAKNQVLFSTDGYPIQYPD